MTHEFPSKQVADFLASCRLLSFHFLIHSTNVQKCIQAWINKQITIFVHVFISELIRWVCANFSIKITISSGFSSSNKMFCFYSFIQETNISSQIICLILIKASLIDSRNGSRSRNHLQRGDVWCGSTVQVQAIWANGDHEYSRLIFDGMSDLN
jgi:hypothetical protein